MYALLLVVAATTQLPTSQDAYDALQKKLRTLRTIEFTDAPATNDSWDRPTGHYWRKPNQAVTSGYGFFYRTDGKRITSNDSETYFNRPVKPGDLKVFAVPGFEALYEPHAKVVGIGAAVSIFERERSLLRLNLVKDGNPFVLVVDALTLLPRRYGDGGDLMRFV